MATSKNLIVIQCLGGSVVLCPPGSATFFAYVLLWCDMYVCYMCAKQIFIWTKLKKFNIEIGIKIYSYQVCSNVVHYFTNSFKSYFEIFMIRYHETLIYYNIKHDCTTPSKLVVYKPMVAERAADRTIAQSCSFVPLSAVRMMSQ